MWMNLELLAAMADARPEWQLIMSGLLMPVNRVTSHGRAPPTSSCRLRYFACLIVTNGPPVLAAFNTVRRIS